jgi:hypothetical protein
MNVSGPKQLITDKRDHAKEHLSKVRKEIKLFEDLQMRMRKWTELLVNMPGKTLRA